MPRNKIRASQIIDSDLVSEDELGANYKSSVIESNTFPVSVASTDSTSKTVTVDSSEDINDWDIQVGDTAEIAGGTPDGDYTIASIVNDTEFTVEESIPDSSNEGDLTVYHPPGAILIGFDDRNLSDISGADLQGLLESIDQHVSDAIGSPSKLGEVLYSANGTDWEREDPMVSGQGWLINNSGILLIK